jgi:hypothetical protein
VVGAGLLVLDDPVLDPLAHEPAPRERAESRGGLRGGRSLARSAPKGKSSFLLNPNHMLVVVTVFNCRDDGWHSVTNALKQTRQLTAKRE